MKPKKRSIFAALAVLVLAIALPQLQQHPAEPSAKVAAPTRADAPLSAEEAQKRRLSRVWVEGAGTVVRILPDDNDGHRHQRFILRLSNGKTLLVAHNIDLAPRLRGLRRGERVAFSGEFVSNSKGGVLHWTHHDPSGRREGGWLRYRGELYR